MAEQDLSKIHITLDSKLIDEHVDAFLPDELVFKAQLVPRIIHERGPFVDINESDLIKEIASLNAQQNSDNDVDMDQDDHDNLEETPDDDDQLINVNETFTKNKIEALKFISTALNESSLALDFVSLLISCVRPAAGTISMSQHLKKFVPPGSLNSDIVNQVTTPQERELRMKNEKIIGQGWKLSSLESSSNKLRDSSIRLSEEILKEKTFWDTIKKNFNNKEILYKTRDKSTGKRIFAVKYGYEDSGSTYKIQGNAILKTTDNNHRIDFVPLNSVSGSEKKLLRVRILKKQNNDDEFTIFGESKIDENFSQDDSIRSQISKARYFIFEEELFNQLIEEANHLLAFNVSVENESKFSINLIDEIIEFEYIEFDETKSPNEQPSNFDKTENSRAELITTYLRLMLTIKYKKNLESKRQPLVVKNSNQYRYQTTPSSLILRPLIGHFKHEQSLKKIRHLIKDLISNVDNSSFKIYKYCNIKKKEYETDSFKRISKPPLSKFKLLIGDSLTIEVVLSSLDYLNQKIHISAHKIEDLFGEGKKKLIDVDFEDLIQVEECLEWIIEEYKNQE
ncbi:Mediator of RNA polymerase II transcription subunit 17 [Wickerhamomyces ciferrii]|uniref:Mediator of RNA polymerase II transcription subunit 17 n=1 Tax=Wickerhamomyces ciferrii (strain ATCC 14091 / BCRC 22168 / CBS 111 / JCM 3599 / NBRC 0793 / NRRL Y-1031 F-60-10) TaxID=1206466 RepID=K0KYC4_WICCF|nr:Mediator of RNA polymerase II transcription subunit 17 [Wickerhamomyces ciferrii]CCH46098.1 Mediator of RNA polymerase II transcription subunit 17 [Wickerhamomyces ciferrii]